MKIRVRLIFLIREKKEVMIDLVSSNWDFSLGAVLLKAAGVEVRGRQVGFGNAGGRAIVVFKPDEPWAQAKDKLQFIQDCSDQITLEQTESIP